MVSSRSSVPSRAKYDDWIGMSRCVAATRALTVRSPRAGGQSMTTCVKPSSLASWSLRRNGASNSPDSRDSSLASEMRAGATESFGTTVGLDDRRQRNRRVDEDVVHALLDLAQIEVRHAAVGLRIEIDEQRRLPSQRQGGGEVESGGRLADAALLVRDGEDHLGCDIRRRRRILGGEPSGGIVGVQFAVVKQNCAETRAISEIGTRKVLQMWELREMSAGRHSDVCASVTTLLRKWAGLGGDVRRRATSCTCRGRRGRGSRATGAGARRRPSRARRRASGRCRSRAAPP